MALIKCTNCGHDVSEYAESCPECGVSISKIKEELGVEILQCSECGSDILETAEVCPNCGIPVSEIKTKMKDGVWCKINNRWKDITWIKECQSWTMMFMNIISISFLRKCSEKRVKINVKKNI